MGDPCHLSVCCHCTCSPHISPSVFHSLSALYLGVSSLLLVTNLGSTLYLHHIHKASPYLVKQERIQLHRNNPQIPITSYINVATLILEEKLGPKHWAHFNKDSRSQFNPLTRKNQLLSTSDSLQTPHKVIRVRQVVAGKTG